MPNTSGDLGSEDNRWTNIWGTTITGTTLTDGTASINGGAITGATNTDWDAAYTHVSNDGSDHSYIDQSVVSGGTPTFDGTNFTAIPDGGLTLTDVTTNDSSTSKHGFCPKLDNNSSNFLDGLYDLRTFLPKCLIGLEASVINCMKFIQLFIRF